MRPYTHAEWIAGAVLEGGVWWREADGEDVEVVSDGMASYGLRGDAHGSITVRAGAGDARSYRWDSGDGSAISNCRGSGTGDAVSDRRGDGKGDARSYRRGWGAGSAIETDRRGTRCKVAR